MKRIWTYIFIYNWTTSAFIDASIAGITYMDDFSFEQRYRDANECNPLYWHPLHLPDKCLKMFDKLIRYRLGLLGPYRVVEDKYNDYDYSDDENYYKINTEEIYDINRSTPFEVLIELLKRDISDIPSKPNLAMSPYLGLMALYKQPISYKTVAMMKKVARAYAKQLNKRNKYM